MGESIKDGGDNASYYELPKNCHRVQDMIIAMDMTWNQANIFKSVIRWDKKPDLEYNLRKIIFFAQDELDRIYAEMRPRDESQ
jgi:hypothetical protein